MTLKVWSLLAASVNMVGVSIGAMIGLEVLSRLPDLIQHLVVFEPPTVELLPDVERLAAEESQVAVEFAFANEGVAAAMKLFMELARFDPSDREAGIAMPSFSPRRLANFTFFLQSDAPAVRQHRFHWQTICEAKDKIDVARGRNSRLSMPGRCAGALAKFLGKQVIEFDGGHNAYVTHPSAFSTRLKELLCRPDV